MRSNPKEKRNGEPSCSLPPPLDPGDPVHQVLQATEGKAPGVSVLPGMDGIPHLSRGTHFYKKDDPERAQPKFGGRVRCMVFNLNNDEERKNYELVVSRVYTMQNQGKAVIRSSDRAFDQREGVWRAIVEWIEFFTYDPFTSPREFHDVRDVYVGPLRRKQ